MIVDGSLGSFAFAFLLIRLIHLVIYALSGFGWAVMVTFLASAGGATSQGSYLVDPASSHMLVSKIKPCMSKYKLLIL